MGGVGALDQKVNGGLLFGFLSASIRHFAKKKIVLSNNHLMLLLQMARFDQNNCGAGGVRTGIGN